MHYLREVPVQAPQSLRVIVVDRLALFRSGLAELIRGAIPGCEVTDAADLESAVAVAASFEADLVLADLDAEGPGARDRLRRLLAGAPTLKVAVLSSASDRDTALAWLQVGAHGCLPKSASLDELCDALRTIRAGHGYVSSSILASPSHSAALAEPQAPLTARQQDVMRLLAEGRPTKDIARRLNLSVSTVKAHLAAAYRTLGAHNRVEAVIRSRPDQEAAIGERAIA
jgi:DNA-binding NarL/FixJ family response regulator